MPCYQDCWERMPAAGADEGAPTTDAAAGAARCVRALGWKDARTMLARDGIRFCSPPCPPQPTPYDADYMPHDAATDDRGPRAAADRLSSNLAE